MFRLKLSNTSGFILSVLLVSLCSVASVFANAEGNVKDSVSLKIEVDDLDGIILEDNSALVYAEIKNHTNRQNSVILEWEIKTDNHVPLFKTRVSQTIEANSVLKSLCPLYRVKEPGFYEYSVSWMEDEKWIATDRLTIGFNPEELEAPVDSEADFDEFWQRAVLEQKQIQPNTRLTQVKRAGTYKTSLYEVEMQSLDGLMVRGWLEVPKKEGIYPALLRVPGYTETLEPIDKYDDLIVFSFHTRDHGNSDNTGPRGWDMWVRGLENKEKFYYRNIILDCLMAMDYLCSRNDVDTSRIAVWGGSQGGGLAFTTAALDHRISLCIADIPFLCEYPRYFEITHWDEIDAWLLQNPDQTWSSMLKTLSYFDTKNMAHRITCPVFMGIGLQDEVCPPSTSFVTYNKIKSKKEYQVYKESKHWQPDSHYEKRFQQLRMFFKMNAAD